MTQNPFDALGGGGFDMNALLEQAQQMQQQLAEAQADLVEPRSTAPLPAARSRSPPTVPVSCVTVAIRAGEFDGSDPDDLSDLGDMIVAAYRDAKAKAEALALGPRAARAPVSAARRRMPGGSGSPGPEGRCTKASSRT